MEETHTVCDKRLKEEGGKATCCYCNPHENCELNQPKCTDPMHDQNINNEGYCAMCSKYPNREQLDYARQCLEEFDRQYKNSEFYDDYNKTIKQFLEKSLTEAVEIGRREEHEIAYAYGLTDGIKGKASLCFKEKIKSQAIQEYKEELKAWAESKKNFVGDGDVYDAEDELLRELIQYLNK